MKIKMEVKKSLRLILGLLFWQSMTVLGMSKSVEITKSKQVQSSEDRVEKSSKECVQAKAEQFNSDYKKCFQALKEGKYKEAKSFVKEYQANAHKSEIAREYAELMTNLYTSMGGKFKQAVTEKRVHSKSIERPQYLKEVKFNEDYKACAKALEKLDISGAKHIVAEYKAQAHSSVIAFEHAQMLESLFAIEIKRIGERTQENLTRIGQSRFNHLLLSDHIALRPSMQIESRNRIVHGALEYRRDIHLAPQQDYGFGAGLSRQASDFFAAPMMISERDASSQIITPYSSGSSIPQLGVVGYNSDGAAIVGLNQQENPTDWLSRRQDTTRESHTSSQELNRNVLSPHAELPLTEGYVYYGSNVAVGTSRGQSLTDATTGPCVNWSRLQDSSEPLLATYEAAYAVIADNKELLAEHKQALENFTDKLAYAPYTMSLDELVKLLENGLPAIEGLSKEVNYALSLGIKELQLRLANVVFDKNGAYKGIVTPRDRNKWAYAVTEFMKSVYKDDYMERITTLAEQGCPGFDAVVYGRSEGMSRILVALQRRTFAAKYKNPFKDIGDTRFCKDALSTNKFNKDVQAVEAAIAKGDLKRAEQIVNTYAHNKEQSQIMHAVQGRALKRAQDAKKAQVAAAVHMQKPAESVGALQSSSSTDVVGHSEVGSRIQWPDDLHLSAETSGYQITEPMTDYVVTGASEDAFYREYMITTEEVLSGVQNAPLREMLGAVRDYVAVQWEDGKNEVGLLLEEATMRHEAHSQAMRDLMERQMIDLVSGKSPLEIFQEAIYEVADLQGVSESLRQDIMILKALSACAQKGITYYNENSEKIETARELALQNKVSEAVEIAKDVDLLSVRIAQKLGQIAKRPVKFVGETARGLVGMAHMFQDRVMPLEGFGGPEARAALYARRAEEVKHLVSQLEQATPDEIYDFTASFIADSIALAAAHKVYARVKSGNALTPTQAAARIEAEGQRVAQKGIQNVEIKSTTVSQTGRITSDVSGNVGDGYLDMLKGLEGPCEGSSIEIKTVVHEPTKKPKPKLTAAEKAAEKELNAKVKKHLNEYNEKQKIKCKQHSEHTVKGVHELTDTQAGLQDVIPGHLENEILAKPFDHTVQTHVHPNLPESINAARRPIVINYSHLSPEFEVHCVKGVVEGKGFHHDYLAKIERSGFIEIVDKITLPNGCYKYRWSSQGTELKSSTFFPAEWTRVQVAEKICESMMPANTKAIEYIGAGKYEHLGLTSEGIPVTSIIKVGESAAKVVTAYPDFVAYNDFLNRGL